MRADYRDFRLDRILNITETAHTFEGKHPTLKDYIAQTASEHKLETIVIRVDDKMNRYINEQKYYNGFVSEIKYSDFVEMTFLTISIEGFTRWFMMFGDMAEVISPAHLKERVAEIADAIVKRNLLPATS